MLHARGWVVLSGVLLPEELDPRQALPDSAFTDIFGERQQGHTVAWARRVGEELTLALPEELLLGSDGHSKRINDARALRCHSRTHDADCAGGGVGGDCRCGAQERHADADKMPAGLSDADVPLSGLLATEPGTRLWVCPRGCCGDAILLELQVGELLIFRGDLAHCGAGYDAPHYRVHIYIDPPAHVYARPPSRTRPCA